MRLKHLCFILLTFPYLAFAQDESDDISDMLELMDLMQLLQTPVTSSSKIEQKTIEAPNVISVVSKEHIKLYGWESLNDILYKQPGFGPAQDYDRHTVSSRGLFEGWNNNHLLFLIDGMPFNDNLYGSAYT